MFQDDLLNNLKYLRLAQDGGGSPITDNSTVRGSTMSLPGLGITGDAVAFCHVGGTALADNGGTLTVEIMHSDIATVGDTLLPGSTIVAAAPNTLVKVRLSKLSRKKYIQAKVLLESGGAGGTVIPFTVGLVATGNVLPMP